MEQFSGEVSSSFAESVPPETYSLDYRIGGSVSLPDAPLGVLVEENLSCAFDFSLDPSVPGHNPKGGLLDSLRGYGSGGLVFPSGSDFPGAIIGVTNGSKLGLAIK